MKETDIIFLIKKLNHLIDMDLENKLAKYSITPSQMRILFYVNCHKDERIRQIDLENHFHFSKSTISGLVNRLINKDYLIRKKEGSTIYLLPGEKVSSFVLEMIKSRDETLELLTHSMNEEEVEELIKNLNTVINNMKGEI